MAKSKKGKGLGVVLALGLGIWSARGNSTGAEVVIASAGMAACLLYAFSGWARKTSLSSVEKFGHWMALIVICCGACAAFGWHFFPDNNAIQEATQAVMDSKCHDLLISWGPEPPPGTTKGQVISWAMLQYVSMEINGNDAKVCAGDKYEKLMGAAFLYYGDTDLKDVPLAKSTMYDIGEGDIKILIPVDGQYKKDLTTRGGGTNYAVIFLPHGVKGDQFSTLRQALRLGAKDVRGANGPP